jgi:RNA-binding protein 23/39
MNLLISRLPKPKTVVSAPDVSRCVLLKNGFDPAEETGDSWARELEEDVRHECESKYGKVPPNPPTPSHSSSWQTLFIVVGKSHSRRSGIPGRNLHQIRQC